MDQFDAELIHIKMRNSLRDRIVAAIQHTLRFPLDRSAIDIRALDCNDDEICNHRTIVFEDASKTLVKLEVSEMEPGYGVNPPKVLFCVGANDLKNTEEVINFLYSVTYLRGACAPNFKVIEISPTRIE